MGTLILMVFMIKNDFCAVMPSLQRGPVISPLISKEAPDLCPR
jgi:hypothetical protein